MTTKGVIGCKFTADQSLYDGMWVNSDGFAVEIADTIWHNCKGAFGGDLERLMRRIYEEPQFYFNFTGKDFSLPNAYFSGGARELVLPTRNAPYHYYRRNEFDWREDMMPEARRRVEEYAGYLAAMGYPLHIIELMILNAAPESASASARWMADPALLDTERTSKNLRRAASDEYTLIVDIPGRILSWSTYDFDEDEEFTILLSIDSNDPPSEIAKGEQQ